MSPWSILRHGRRELLLIKTISLGLYIDDAVNTLNIIGTYEFVEYEGGRISDTVEEHGILFLISNESNLPRLRRHMNWNLKPRGVWNSGL